MTHPEITRINFRDRFVEADGGRYPITQMFDDDLNDCDSDDAETIVAGAGNFWIALLVADFGEVIVR